MNYNNNNNNLDSSISPTLSQTNFLDSKQISIEELQWLLKNLSIDDRNKLGAQMKQCSSEMFMKRALPLTALICGGLYYARKRLPQLQFGKTAWPMLIVSAVGSLTITNLLTVNTCGERVKPLLIELYQKYDKTSNSSLTYEQLRRTNRLTAQQKLLQNYENKREIDEKNSFLETNLTNNFNKTKNNLINDQTNFLQNNEMTFMPGTPYDLLSTPKNNEINNYSLINNNENSNEKLKNQYGDVDFS